MNPQNALKTKLTPKAYLIAASLWTGITILCGIFAFLQPDTGRYLAHSPLSVLFCILPAVGLAAALFAVLVFPKRSEYISDAPLFKKLEILPALASLCCAAANLFVYKEEKKFFTLLLIIVAIVSVLSFAARLLKFSDKLVLLLGYIRVLFLAGVIAQLYLDTKVEMNSPYKLILQFSLAAVMLDALAEIAPLAGKKRYGRRFLFSQAAIILLSPIAAVATIFSFRIPELLSTEYIAYCILSFSCLPHAILRLINCQIRELPPEQSPKKGSEEKSNDTAEANTSKSTPDSPEEASE